MINTDIDNLSSFRGLLLFLWHITVPFIDPSAILFFFTFVTRKCFNKVLPYCSVGRCHAGVVAVYSPATSSAESVNTDLPIRRYLHSALKIKNDWFYWSKIDNAQCGPWVYWGDLKGKSCIYNTTVLLAKLCLLATQSMYHCVCTLLYLAMQIISYHILKYLAMVFYEYDFVSI